MKHHRLRGHLTALTNTTDTVTPHLEHFARSRYLVFVVTCVSILLFLAVNGTGNSDVKINDVQIFDLPNNMKQPPHLTPLDPTVLVPRGYVSLDKAHRSGRIHKGSWIHIMDSTGNVLLLRRGAQLVTCPLSWSLVGEHAYRDEAEDVTLRRGIIEELGQATWDLVAEYKNLSTFPLFYFRDYGPSHGNRVDRQLTYIWLVQLSVTFQDANKVIDVDDEVQEIKWMPADQVEEWVRHDKDGGGKKIMSFCHDTITSLMLFSLGRVREMQTQQQQEM